MSDYYLENHQGDFEDQEDLIWNEFDWQQYLNKNKRDINKLAEFYKSIQYNRVGYLEEICKFMGWESFDVFSSQDGEMEEISIETTAFFSQEETEESSESEAEPDPYTIHKHPLYCVSMALYQFIQEQCEELLVAGKNVVSAIELWRFSTSLLASQSNVLMAVYSIDFGDHVLAICHLKQVLNAVNESFKVLNQLPNKLSSVKQIVLALFTFREILLKVITDCREYDNSEFGDVE
jgi:hypothetical protein